jgi:DNA processing protein
MVVPFPDVVDDEALALLALARTPDLGPVRIAALLDVFGTAQAIVAGAAGSGSTAAALAGLNAARLARALRGVDLRAARREAERGRRLGARLVCAGTPTYPVSWRLAEGWPPVLWVRGEWPATLRAAAPVSLAVVGPRRASSTACRFAAQVAERSAWAGAWVVSGLAFGVDAAAHSAAVAAAQAGAPAATVAVLASGVDRPTPTSHRDLARSILDTGGSLVAAAAIGTGPPPGAFPVRNRWIAGLSGAVVVVEAGARSGALHTASAGLELGREVLVATARPWDEHAAGSLGLIRDGATPLVVADDAWRALPAGTREPRAVGTSLPAPWDRLLTAAPRSAEALAGSVGQPIGATLAALEAGVLAGWARRVGAHGYVRADAAPSRR